MAPSLLQPPAPKSRNPDWMPAYFFITARKKPGDRKYLDELLRLPPDELQNGHHWNRGTGSIEISAGIGPHERQVADYLSRLWDGETNIDTFPQETYMLIPDHPLRAFGAIRAEVQLGLPLPDDPGYLSLYLIPAALPGANWTNGPGLVTYRSSFVHRSEQLHDRRPTNIMANLKGVLPATTG